MNLPEEDGQARLPERFPPDGESSVVPGGQAEPERRLAACLNENNRLREQAAQLQQMVALLKEAETIAGAGSWSYDVRTGQLIWSDGMYRLYGYEPGEITPDMNLLLNATHPDDRQLTLDVIDRARQDRKVHSAERRIFLPDGAMRYVRTSIRVQADEQGEIIHFAGTGVDITEQKTYENQLADSRRFIGHVTEAIPDLLYVDDIVHNTNVFVNKDFFQTLGYAPEDVQPSPEAFFAGILHPDDRRVFLNRTEKFSRVADHQTVSSVYRIRHRDGNWRYFASCDVVFKRDAADNPVQILGISRDVTDRQQMEAELRSVNQILEGLLTHFPVAIAHLDKDGTVLVSRGNGLRDLGLADNQIVGENIFTSFPQVSGWVRQVLAGSSVSFVSAVPAPDKTVFFQNFYFPDHTTGGAVGLAINITSQHEAEAEVLAKNQLISGILAQFPIVISRYNPQGIILECIGSGLRRAGIADNQLAGKNVYELYPQLTEHIRRTLQGEVIVAVGELLHEGRKVYFLSQGFWDAEQQQAVWFSLDITAQKEAEAQMKAQNRLLEIILNRMPVMINRIDKQGVIREIAGLGLRRIGRQDNDLVGVNALEAYPQVADYVRQALRGEDVTFIGTPEYQGEKQYFLNHYFYDAEREQAVGFGVDITEQKQLEQTLREANEQLQEEATERELMQEELQAANDHLQAEIQWREEVQQAVLLQKEFNESLIQNSVDGIFAFDNQTRLTAWNKTMERDNRLTSGEVLGKSVFEFFPDDLHNEKGRAVYAALAGKPTTLYDVPYTRREGFYEVTFIPLFGPDNQVVGGFAIERDTTERKKLEEERIRQRLTQQKETMNAVLNGQEQERRRLAESLHNGLGQTLYAIKLNVERLAAQADTDAKSLKAARQQINTLLDEAIRETRSISRELIPTVLEDFGLESAIREALKRIRQQSLRFTVEISLARRLEQYLEVAVFRITQELINNIIKHADATHAAIRIDGLPKSIRIRVTDNGKGFNSRKSASTATGIGIRSIRERIKLLNGKMTIQSKPGTGTEISIRLPVL